jgi:hypothetical protein
MLFCLADDAADAMKATTHEAKSSIRHTYIKTPNNNVVSKEQQIDL